MSFTKKRNEEFKGDYHQDCHEFLTWYINEIDDVLNGKITKSVYLSSRQSPASRSRWCSNANSSPTGCSASSKAYSLRVPSASNATAVTTP
jgi:hypothetical protein